MRQLHPTPIDPVDPASLLAPLRLGDGAPVDRPYVAANFVASVDGRATVDGGSTGLGDAGDRAIFRALRGVCDAVLAGIGTLAVEHYGALARDPSVAALRGRLGLPAQPPLVTVARHGELPAIPLLDDPASTLVAYLGPDVAVPENVRATVEVVRRAPDALTVPAVLEDLRVRRGVRLLLCEGGPSLFGDLVAARACDELFLTVSALVAGGDPAPITRHLALDASVPLALRWVLQQDDSLYLRYGVGGR